MIIQVSDPNTQTLLFSVIFLGLLFASIQKGNDEKYFSLEKTLELKGLAIFSIIFAHIGYFLSSSTNFLYPFSVLGGVGVNIFLFLSGFGLCLSSQKHPLSPLAFYKKRLSKLFIPLWAVITIYFLLDYFVLHKAYPLSEIFHSFLGFYPRADLFQNLNSPLWYISITLFYYIIFPFAYIRKIPFLSPLIILALSLLLLNLPLPVHPDVLKLYKLHYLAFPLGLILGLIIPLFRLRINKIVKLIVIGVCLIIFAYTAIHSEVGTNPLLEQNVSIVTTLSLVIILYLSGLKVRLLGILGAYSYFIYLIHWPLLSRYNYFSAFPPFLQVILNILLIFGLAYVLQKAIRYITASISYFILS